MFRKGLPFFSSLFLPCPFLLLLFFSGRPRRIFRLPEPLCPPLRQICPRLPARPLPPARISAKETLFASSRAASSMRSGTISGSGAGAVKSGECCPLTAGVAGGMNADTPLLSWLPVSKREIARPVSSIGCTDRWKNQEEWRFFVLWSPDICPARQ